MEENILDYVRGCRGITSQPGGAIFLNYPHTSPRIVVKLPLLVLKCAKIGQNRAKSSDFGTLK